MSRSASETLTIVFSDLVGSTEIRGSLGEDTADRFGDIHMAMLTSVVGRHDGRIVKRTGDGVLAVFDSAVDAIDASIVMQQEADRYTHHRDAIAPTRIRVGISTGDVSRDTAGDVAGATAVEAKRLEEVARPGQILCSELTRLIARGRGGHVFASLGEVDLKGFPDPVGASEVLWERGDVRSPHPLPAALAVPEQFVGRDHEVDEVGGAVAARGATSPIRLVVVTGEPGIGKSTLASVVANAAFEAGRVVLFGRCDAELAVPFRPFAEAIDHWARYAGVHGIDPRHRLLGQLSAAVEAVLGAPTTAHPDARTAQLALFDSVRQWCAEVEPLIVIDDLHWATEQTVLLIRHLAQSAEPDDSVVLATVRAEEEPAHLRACLEDAVSRGRATIVHLGGLDHESIRSLTGTDRPELLAERTGGNPLFLQAISSADGPSTTIEAAVARRVRAVDEEICAALRVAAVAGLEFDSWLLATVLELDEDGLLDRLGDAISAGLVREQGPGRFVFSHGLVQEVLANELGRTRRAHLHRRLAVAIEAADPGRVADLARHYDEAGDRPKAIEYLTAAAERADDLADLESAERLHRRLQALHDDPATSLRHRWHAVRAAMATRWITAETHDEALTVCDEAHELGQLDVEVQAMVATAAFINQTARRPSLAHIRRLDVDAIDDPDLRLLAASVRCYTEFIVGLRSPAECLALLESVRDLVERTREPYSAAFWHSTFALTQIQPDALDDRRVAGEAALQLLAETSLPVALLATAGPVCTLHLQAGDAGAATRLVDRCQEIARGRAMPFGRLMVNSVQVVLHHLAGRFNEAQALAEEVDTEATRLAVTAQSGVYGIQRFMLLRDQGRLGEVAGPIRAISSLDADEARTWRPGLAALYAELGMVGDARRTVTHVLEHDEIPDQADSRYLAVLSFLADATAASGDRSAARRIAALLDPYAGQHVVIPTAAYFGPVHRLLGLLAGVLGDRHRAEGVLRRAIEEAAATPSPVYEARACVDLAGLLAAPGAGDEATMLASRGLAIAEALGMAGVVDRARALLGPAAR